MYQEFSIISIEPILNKKQIIITASQAINVYEMDNTVIEIYERASKTSILFSKEMKEKVITLTFKEWPIPNSEYILIINGLKSIIDQSLSSNVKKRIKFESNIISTVKILNPSIFEQIETLNIDLKELAQKEEDIKNSFYIEIAKDNSFIDTVIKTNINKTSFKLFLPKFGQYYMRVRVQDGLLYGLWSDLLTFKYGTVSESGDMPEITEPDIEDEDDLEPEVDIEEFELISKLEQGVTPKTLLLEFSKEVDTLSLDNIIIIRKVVK